MQRAVASLLIALVGLMAWLPQALCPCAQRTRAEVAQALDAGRPIDSKACCPLCEARKAALARRALAQTSDADRAPNAPAPAPLPPPCPCCEVNGKGKYMLQLGDVVRPAPELAVGLPAQLPAPSAWVLAPELRVEGVVGDDPPDEPAPALRRAGVVLLI